MGFKEELAKEREELKNVKRPYETAAFIVFTVMLFQQLAYWLLRIINFSKDIKAAAGAWNPNFSTNLPTTPAFVIRIIQIDSTKWIWVFVGVLALALWYFLIYVFVWNYCRKRGLAKWTWTAIISFGPTSILFIPVYLIYALYVFRPFVFRFIRRGVEEYKKYNENFVFNEDVTEEVVKEEPKEEPKEV